MTNDVDLGSGFLRRERRGARWLLFTHPGRTTLAAAYSIAAVASIVTYTVVRSPLFGAGQFALTAFGLAWTRWCLRRA